MKKSEGKSFGTWENKPREIVTVDYFEETVPKRSLSFYTSLKRMSALMARRLSMAWYASSM